jgi:hypothetical protein
LDASGFEKVKLLSLITNWGDPGTLYVPILPQTRLVSPDHLLREQDVTKLLLRRFPVPAPDVAWEDILEFREDSQHRGRLLALRRWVTQMAAGNSSDREIVEEIDYLLQEFERAFSLHKIKYEYSQLELITTATLEALENVIKLNFGKAAKAIFDFRKSRVDFLIKQWELPGKELAYLSAVRKTLGVLYGNLTT